MHREMVPWYCGTPHVTLTHSVRTQAQRQDSHESVAEHAGGRKGQPGANHGVVESDVAVPDAVLSEPLLKNKAVHRLIFLRTPAATQQPSLVAIQREQEGLGPTGSIANKAQYAKMCPPPCVPLGKAKPKAICAKIAAELGMRALEDGETPAAFLKRYDSTHGPRPEADCKGSTKEQCIRLATAQGLSDAQPEPRPGLGDPSAAGSCGAAVLEPAARAAHERSEVRGQRCIARWYHGTAAHPM